MTEPAWRELINQLREELNYVEGVLENSSYNEKIRLIVTRGCIINFADSLYEEENIYETI